MEKREVWLVRVMDSRMQRRYERKNTKEEKSLIGQCE